MKEEKVKNPIPKPLQKMLEGFGINSYDLFIQVKNEVEKLKSEEDKK